MDVLLDPLSTERRENAPEEAPIRPATKVHLLIGEVLDKILVVADLRPNVLDGILWQPVSKAGTRSNLLCSEALLLITDDLLKERHPTLLQTR